MRAPRGPRNPALNSVKRCLQRRVDWLENTGRGDQNTPTKIEIRNLQDAIRRVDLQRSMREFLYERELLDEFWGFHAGREEKED